MRAQRKGKRGRRLLSLGHAGQRIGVGARRAAQLFDSGALRGIRDSSGRRLIDEDSVDELLARRQEAQEHKPAAGG